MLLVTLLHRLLSLPIFKFKCTSESTGRVFKNTHFKDISPKILVGCSQKVCILTNTSSNPVPYLTEHCPDPRLCV